MRCRLYVIIDNTYARRALDGLFKLLAQLREEHGLPVDWPVAEYRISQPVNVCDNKLTRYVEGAIKNGYDLILIVYDLEREVTEDHVQRHLTNLSSAERRKVKQLPSKPCHEVWLCEVMGIAGSSSLQLCDEVIELINRHLGKRGEEYRKSRFHTLLIQYTLDYINGHGTLPGYLARIIDAVKTGCGGRA
ncbi:MAG: hypothetical protein QXF69_08470 [Thermofilaceae archaeon]